MIISLIIIFALVLILFYISPFSIRIIKPGKSYYVGEKLRIIPDLTINGKNVFFLKRKVLRNMHDLLLMVHQELEKNDIPYWITCGTLLGCLRHGGFIPWDDDIDINIEIRYTDKLTSILSGLENKGFLLCEARGGYKFGFSNIACYPYVDIVMVNNDDNTYKLCYPLDESGECTYEVGKQWPDECFAMDDVFPLQLRKFEDFEVYTPYNSRELLEKIYGDDCFTAAGTRSNAPYGYSLKSFPWLFNHYFDNLLFRLGLHDG